MNKKDIIYILIISFLLFGIIYRNNNKKIITEYRETIKYDTVTHELPIPIISYIDNDDSILLEDVDLYIPMETKIYKDSLYEVQISGYKPRIDNIKVFNKNTIQTITNTVREPKKGFYYGVQLGCGYGVISNKADIYLGVGIGYRF